MPREKSLATRVLQGETVDYSAYSISQLKDCIETLAKKVKPAKRGGDRINVGSIKRHLNSIQKLLG